MSQKLPETVHFETNKIDCIFFLMVNNFGFNMRTCSFNYIKKPLIEIAVIDDFSRVFVTRDHGDAHSLWFDTSHKSAAEIVTLLETGKSPSA